MNIQSPMTLDEKLWAAEEENKRLLKLVEELRVLASSRETREATAREVTEQAAAHSPTPTGEGKDLVEIAVIGILEQMTYIDDYGNTCFYKGKSLEDASASISALLSSRISTLEGERDEARKMADHYIGDAGALMKTVASLTTTLEELRRAVAWVDQVYPETLPWGGAKVEMTWDEYNAMREAIGLKSRKPIRARSALHQPNKEER